MPTIDRDEVRKHQRAARVLRKELRDLSDAVLSYLAVLDAVMREPESVERGRKIARLSNALELANDQARRFGLGRSITADGKARAVAKLRIAALPAQEEKP